MIYTIIPIEEIMAMQNENPEEGYEYIKYEGKTLCVERTCGDDMKIVSLISSDPMDYLNSSLAPGSIIEAKYK